MKPALAIMAKLPQPGQAKTRLSPPLSLEQAARVYAACLQDVIENALAVPGLDVFAAVSPPQVAGDFVRLAPGVPVMPVSGRTIGRCLDSVLGELLAAGRPMAAAISSDSPDLWPEIIAQGFDLLRQADVVFGPSPDGGYYFVGLKRPAPELFSDDIAWSTPAVLEQSLARARGAGLHVRLLPGGVSDVDTAADLVALRHALQCQPPGRARHTRAVLD